MRESAKGQARPIVNKASHGARRQERESGNKESIREHPPPPQKKVYVCAKRQREKERGKGGKGKGGGLPAELQAVQHQRAQPMTEKKETTYYAMFLIAQ